MGLDMYLSAKRSFYDPAWREDKPDKDALIARKLRAIREVGWPDETGDLNCIEVGCDVTYWRKANHIHHWFVDNCQDGVDDCRPAYVAVDQLRELRDLCADVVGTGAGNPKIAEAKLPVRDGFFFGGTEYDEIYFEQTKDTLNTLNKLIGAVDSGKLKGWEFYYRSSW